MIKFSHLIFAGMCVAVAAAMQSAGAYRDSLPYAPDAPVYISDIKLPLIPGPMCKADGELEVDPVLVTDAASL